MIRFVRGLVLNIHLVRSHMFSPKFLSPIHSQIDMFGHILTSSGDGGHEGHENEGEGGADQNGSLFSWCGGESIEPLLLLIQATQVNRCPLPIGSFTAKAVVAMVQRHTGHHPVDVDVMSDQDEVIELEPDMRVAQLLHGTHEGDGHQLPVIYSLQHD